MRQGTGSSVKPGDRIDCRAVRKVDAEAALLAVVEYLNTNGGSISDAARVFGFNR
jgi:hypothetical protein